MWRNRRRLWLGTVIGFLLVGAGYSLFLHGAELRLAAVSELGGAVTPDDLSAARSQGEGLRTGGVLLTGLGIGLTLKCFLRLGPSRRA